MSATLIELLPRPRAALLLLAAAVGLWAAPAGRADDKDNKDDTAKLVGDWVVTAVNERGKASDPKDANATHTTFTFTKDGKFSQSYGDPEKPTTDASGTFKIDATKKPREMELVVLTSDKQERDIPAIYELDENTLRIAMPNKIKDAKRPANFDGGDNITVFVCKRK